MMGVTDNSSNMYGTALLGKDEIIGRLTTDDTDKKILISPILSSKQIQPASIDVRLGHDFRIIKIGKITHLDPLKDPKNVKREVRKYTDEYKILNKHESFILHPDEFVLGSTLEYICLPVDIACRLEGRSSWGRVGILIHITAGYIDPGYRGNVTFELKNVGKIPIPLYPGVRIGQLAFFNVSNGYSYSGKYQESFGIVSSKYFEDEEFKIIRKMYSEEYYENIITDIFESVELGTGLPRTLSHEKFPQELVDALADVYRRALEGKNEEG